MFVFTRGSQNRGAWSHFVRFLGVGKKEASTLNETWNKFVTEGPAFTYLRYRDADHIDRIYANGQLSEDLETRMRDQMLKILESIPGGPGGRRSALLVSFYDFIMRNMSTSDVDQQDFSVEIGSNRRQGSIRANLVDLVFYVTDKKSRPPPHSAVLLFLLLQAKFSIPGLYVRSEHFRAAGLEAFQVRQTASWARSRVRRALQQPVDGVTPPLGGGGGVSLSPGSPHLRKRRKRGARRGGGKCFDLPIRKRTEAEEEEESA